MLITKIVSHFRDHGTENDSRLCKPVPGAGDNSKMPQPA
jgi:hypothetical protein